MLTIGEMFPAGRMLEDDKVKAVEMKGIEHMGQYVFEITRAKIESLKQGTEKPPVVEEVEKVDTMDDEVDEGEGQIAGDVMEDEEETRDIDGIE